MSLGDFGNFGDWSPQEHAINKMVYDESHKKGGGSGNGGGGNGNSGCAIILVIIIFIILIIIFWH